MNMPWRGTTEEISAEVESRYETPGGAQEKVNSATKGLDDRLQYFINQSGNSVAEIVDARFPAEGAPFPNVRARMNKTDKQLNVIDNDLLDREINVKYPPTPLIGAMGDGISDDWSAIQSVLDLYEKVYIPAGTYAISKPLVMNQPNQVVFGTGYNTTIIKPLDNFVGEFLFLMDGTTSPAYRSNQKLEGIGLRAKTDMIALKLNRNADFIVNGCRMYNALTGIYFIDTLLYTINHCRIDANDTAFYFYGSKELSANNSVTFSKNVILFNRVVIAQKEGVNIGSNMCFYDNEIEANGVEGETEPLITIIGVNRSQNVISFKGGWFENNRNKTTFKIVMGSYNTVQFDNCRILNNAGEVDYFINAEPFDVTSNGAGACLEIINTYDPSQYVVNTVKTTGLITLQAPNFHYLSIDINNIAQSYVKKAGLHRFVTDVTYQDGKGMVMYSPSGTGANRISSVSANALTLSSELGYINLNPASYWGSTSATSYTKPFRIGNVWIFQNGNYLYMKTGAVAPTSATDGTIISLFVPPPVSATSSGLTGNWSADANFYYVCYATNAWRRVAVTTW